MVRKIVTRIQHAILRTYYRLPMLRHFRCCICGGSVGGFLPYQGGTKNVPPLMIALEVIGSDVDNFSCPKCGAHDRERHLYLYFTKLGLFERFKGASILHVAPEQRLSDLIENETPEEYIRCDLSPSSSQVVQVNVEDIPFEDSRFDFVIANHVLEHVDDDTKALVEIHRVLKPGGFAVLQTPFSPKLRSTFSDAGIDTDDARLQAHGEVNHVRLPGSEIFERISSHGFKSHVVSHREVLADVNAREFGVNHAEPLFLFERLA